MDYHLQDQFNRRTFLKRTGGVGLAALMGILAEDGLASTIIDNRRTIDDKRFGGLQGVPHYTPKAKRVIYLFQSGAPSQLELYDPKPELTKRLKENLPDSVRMGQRLTGMTSGQKEFPVAPGVFKYQDRKSTRLNSSH